MDNVSSGEVGLGNNGHAQTPGEAAGQIGGVGGPELDMVEPLDTETIGHGVGAQEVGEAHQLEPRRRVANLRTAVACFSHFSGVESSGALGEGRCGSVVKEVGHFKDRSKSSEGRELLDTCYHWSDLSSLIFQ